MKKNVLLGFAACGAMLCSANVASAQETVVIEETTISTSNVECKDHYYADGGNWFLQLGAGIQSPFGNRGENYEHKITANYNLSVGRWFSPYLGFRLSAYYGGVGFQPAGDIYYRAKAANLNFDLMWDMFNSFGVNTHRVFSIIPFVGVGGTFCWDYHTPEGYSPVGAGFNDNEGNVKSNQWTLPVSAGLEFRFRCSQYVDIFLQGRANFYSNSYFNIAGGDPIGANLQALAGISINFGGRDFKKYNPCEYLPYINDLNNQINDLRGALATCGAALAACEAQLPCPEVVAVECPEVQAPLMSTVRFTINSAKVTSTEMVNVYNIAQWMKANPDTKVVIKGYADKKTGTASYNMQLSQRRAQSVYNILTKEYGVDANRLVMKAEGSDSQVYDVNNWNRIVIFSQD
ncbi:MAG: OmpA family protein [Muribaculum sp.]|nr:OmpA family protein [Muribaculum sp.]